jgi:hypothetical protein
MGRLRTYPRNHRGREDTLPLTFDEREGVRSANVTAAEREGTILIPVFIDPTEFFSFCKKWKILLNKTTCKLRQQPRASKAEA